MLFARRAEAIGSCTCSGNGFSVPQLGATPLNARLFVTAPDHDLDSTLLTCGKGPELPITISPAGGAEHRVWIAPQDLLPPDEACAITVRRKASALVADGGPSPAATSVFRFHTGTTIDEVPPAVQSVKLVPGGTSSDCGSGPPGAYVELKGLRDDVTSMFHAAVLVQIDVTGPGGTQRLFAAATQVSGVADVTAALSGDNGQAAAGTGGIDCVGDARLRGGRPGVTYAADVTIWDWAGNSTVKRGIPFVLSSPDAPIPAPVEDRPSTGCSLAGGKQGDLSFAWAVGVTFALSLLLRSRAALRARSQACGRCPPRCGPR